jgi:hypothetical protein
LEFGGVLRVVKKPLTDKLDLIEFLFHNFQSEGVEQSDKRMDFVLDIQMNCKNWVWKENLVEPLIFAYC